MGLPLIQPRRLRDPEAMDQLRAWSPDLIVVAAFGQILRPEVLDLPLYGSINVHASLLPRWRGAAPHWMGIAGACCGLALVFRLTPAFAVSCGIAVAALVASPWRSALRDLAVYALGIAIVALPACSMEVPEQAATEDAAVEQAEPAQSPEEVQAVSSFDLYDDIAVRRRYVAELQRSGSVTAWEQPQRRKDGSRVWVLLSASLTEDEEGKLTIIDGSLIDVSERRRLETQLAQVQKLEALGQLAGGIAHDFNNLLTAISGSTSLLELRFPQIAADTHELATIRKTVERGAELTRRLLAIARQQVLRMETLDLNQVIDDELEILRRVIPENIGIHFQPSSDLPPVRADRG